MLEEIKQKAEFIKSKLPAIPQVGIVLGSGLGNLANEIEEKIEIPYSTIPGFPVSTVAGHSGAFVFGKIGGKHVIAMKGRFHFYEGWSMNEVVLPIRVMKFLGISHLLLSNAAGGVNPGFEVGDIMLINDQINLFPENPLRGKNIDELGPRFPDMSEPYDLKIVESVKKFAGSNNILVREGVYVGVTGPTYETKAEYNYVRVIGGDAVGMSTVPEVIAAVHCGLKCFAVSVITDLGVEGKIIEITHDMVQNIANEVTPKLSAIFKHIISEL